MIDLGKWQQFVDALITVQNKLPPNVKLTTKEKGDEIIQWLNEAQPELKDAYDSSVKEISKGYELQIRSKSEFAEAIARKQFGFPERPGDAPKPITFTSPEEIARVLSEMYEERALWEAQGGYQGTGRSNPFTDAAEAKLIREGKIIRRGGIAGRPGSRYIDTVIQRKLPVIRENYAKAVRKTFRDAFRRVAK